MRLNPTQYWTEEKFLKVTGDSPTQDDLERVNCPLAGKIGHRACGVCEKHNKPIFICQKCFSELA